MSVPNSTVRSYIPLILIADDDRSMRTLLDLAVTEQGYRATSAKDGEQCLSEYVHQQPDMVLLDAVMPEMDGFECCGRLRQMPGGDRTPILMITVLDDRESVDRAFEAGATDYITKPIHWAVLSQRVRYLLAASESADRSEMVTVAQRESQQWAEFFREIVAAIARRIDSLGNVRDGLEMLLTQLESKLQDVSGVQRVVIAPVTEWEPMAIELSDLPTLPLLSVAELGLFSLYEKKYRQGKAIALDDLNSTELSQSVLGGNAKSALMVPISIGDRFWGLLCCHYCTQPHSWETVEIEYFSHLANLLAIAIARF